MAAATQSVNEPGGTLSYVGNSDYRGYLAGLAAGGDKLAQTLIGSNGSLGYVNNSGQISSGNGNGFDVLSNAGQLSGENSKDYSTYESLVNGTGTGSGSSGSGSGTASDPNAVAYYNDVVSQLQSELGEAQGEQTTGINNINNSFNDEVNQLNQGESTAESSYNTQAAENGQQREGNLNTIASGAKNAYDALQSLLSGAGSGVSSAAKYGAPQAVSLNASQQRSGADTTYNTNATAIDTARKNTETQFGTSLADLNSQKSSQIENFMSNLLGEEANLNQQIGAAKINAAEYGGKGYAAAEAGAGNETSNVGNIEDQLGKIFQQYATPTFSVTPVTASTPQTSTYQYDPTSVSAASSNPGTDSSIATYLPKQTSSTNATSGLTTGAATPVAAGA